MAMIRIYTTPTCGHCKEAKEWFRDQECDFEELDITSDVEILREWRELSGGAGVPVIAHGKDVIIGFNPDRLSQFVDCVGHTTEVESPGP